MQFSTILLVTNLLLLTTLSFFSQNGTEFKFDFGSGKTAKGYTQVSAESVYSKKKALVLCQIQR